MKNAANEYLAQEIQCADPVRLVELLFQRAVRDLRSAIELWPNLDRSPAAIHMLVHAQCIVKELQNSLNMAEGGELAANLGRVYEYIQFKLVEITARTQGNEPEQIAELLEVLNNISDGWTQMMKQSSSSQMAGVLGDGDSLVA